MCKTGMISLSVAILFAVLVESNGSAGCEWSGCKEFAGAPCKTGVTGGMGRVNRYNSRSCGFQGRKDYCCASDCRYVECGINVIGGIRFTSTVPNETCGRGVVTTQTFKEFICGGQVENEYQGGIGFRSTGTQNDYNGGFMDSSGGSGFRNSNNGGFRSENGIRNNDETSNGTNSEVGNGGFRTR